MFKVFVILNILILCAQSKNLDVKNIEYVEYETDIIEQKFQSIEIEPRQFLISWEAQRALRKILKQMPCGWSNFNIPPTAPYENENLTLSMQNNFANFYASFQPLRIDGLDNMSINTLEVSLLTISKRVNFDFNFPNITATGKFNLSTTIDHSGIGLKLNFAGLGQLNVGLENLRLRGSFKINLPLLWGSVKIYDFKTMLTIGDVRAQLNGTLNEKPITSGINNAIEHTLLTAVNDNQILLSALMEELLVPRVNAQLKGKKLWDIIKWSLSLDDSKCEAVKNTIDDSPNIFEF